MLSLLDQIAIESLKKTRENYNPDEARDANGKWVSAGDTITSALGDMYKVKKLDSTHAHIKRILQNEYDRSRTQKIRIRDLKNFAKIKQESTKESRNSLDRIAVESIMKTREDYNPDEQRDDHGKWSGYSAPPDPTNITKGDQRRRNRALMHPPKVRPKLGFTRKSLKNSISSASASAVLKKESRHSTEALSVISASDAQGVAEGPKIRVALITEGLGNKRDMNYYGPEAVQSAPAIFEGKPMMMNHMGEADDRNRPEGDVEKTVGYYKNLHVEKLNGKLACVGELHFDLTQEGQNAYQKAKTAIHYHGEFGPDKDYVGISINAGGRSESRIMTIDGKRESVNYILGFEDARSADMVTLPARGGTFIALMESVAGAKMRKEESRMETLKRLDAALAALSEAEGEKDSETRTKKIVEAKSQVDSLKNELIAAAEAEAKKPPMDDDDDDCESEDESESKKEAKKKPPFGKDKDEDESESKKESNREAMQLAVKTLISESKLNPKYFDEHELARMSLSEAKKEIARTKRVHEATAQEMVRMLDEDVSAGHPMRESAFGGKSAGNRNEEFPVISA